MLLSFPLLDPHTLDDTTMPLDDSSKTNPKVHVCSPLTSETTTLNPQDGEQGRRYPLHIIKNLIGWVSQNHPLMLSIPFFILSLIITYLRLTLLLLFSYPLSILTHFQEALKDPKWKFATIEEMKAL